MNDALPRFARLSSVTTQLVELSTRQLQRDLAAGRLTRHGKPGGVVLVDIEEVKTLYRLDRQMGPSVDQLVDEILHDIRPARRLSRTKGRTVCG